MSGAGPARGCEHRSRHGLLHMKEQISLDSRLIALSQWERSVPINPSTTWRWRKKGWLRVVKIANRNYLTAEALEEFMARAGRGEFAVSDRDLNKLGKEGK
jgi:hypothetical protein